MKCPSKMDCWANVSIPSAHHALVTTLDVHLLDPKGSVCVKQALELWVTLSIMSESDPVVSLVLFLGCLTSEQHTICILEAVMVRHLVRYIYSFTSWLLNVEATCLCVSETDLLGEFYVLPHRNRSCRSNFLYHPVTVY